MVKFILNKLLRRAAKFISFIQLKLIRLLCHKTFHGVYEKTPIVFKVRLTLCHKLCDLCD